MAVNNCCSFFKSWPMLKNVKNFSQLFTTVYNCLKWLDLLTIVVLFQIMDAAMQFPTVWGLKARLPDDRELVEGATWIPSLKWSAGKIWMETILHDASKLRQDGRFWEKEECKQFRKLIKVTKIEHTLTHAQ
jgi:hypothetical protein